MFSQPDGTLFVALVIFVTGLVLARDLFRAIDRAASARAAEGEDDAKS
jgi:hypothetical protein